MIGPACDRYNQRAERAISNGFDLAVQNIDVDAVGARDMGQHGIRGRAAGKRDAENRFFPDSVVLRVSTILFIAVPVLPKSTRPMFR